MSTMNSIQTAVRQHRDEQADDENRDGMPLWAVAAVIVVAVVAVVGLADLGLLPAFSADDMTSLLFCSG